MIGANKIAKNKSDYLINDCNKWASCSRARKNKISFSFLICNIIPASHSLGDIKNNVEQIKRGDINRQIKGLFPLGLLGYNHEIQH